MKKLLILPFFLALTFVGDSDTASARSDTTLHGYARGADQSCFGESWGSMVNLCSVTKQLFIPASIDRHCISGSSWKVTAQSDNPASNVCCRMIGINGTQITGGSWQCLPSFGSPQQITLTGAALWQDRAFYVCNVGPNTKVIGIDWSANGDC